MDENRLFRLAGWASILSMVSTLLSLTTYIWLATTGDWGPFADLSSFVWVAFTIPVILALHVILRSQAPALSLAAATIGILSLLVAGIFQALLVTGVLTYEQQSPIVISATGTFGIWLVVASYLAMRGKVLPLGLTWVGLITGAGFLLLGVGFWVGGQQSPLTYAGAIATFLGSPIWAIWLGVWILRSRSPQPAFDPAQRKEART